MHENLGNAAATIETSDDDRRMLLPRGVWRRRGPSGSQCPKNHPMFSFTYPAGIWLNREDPDGMSTFLSLSRNGVLENPHQTHLEVASEQLLPSMH